MKTWRTQCSDPPIYRTGIEQCRPLYFPCSSEKLVKALEYPPAWEYRFLPAIFSYCEFGSIETKVPNSLVTCTEIRYMRIHGKELKDLLV